MANYPTSVSTDANLYVAKNQLATQLDGSLTNVATTVTVDSTTNFPTTGAITIDSEVIFYTNTTSTTFTGCTRGADGTGATTHSDNAPVRHTNVAFHHNGLKDEVIAIETALGTNLSGVPNVALTGLSAVAGAITASDTIKTAFNKLINARIVSINVQTNTGAGSTSSTTFAAMFNGPTVTPQSTANKFLIIYSGQLGINPASSQTAYFSLFKSVGGGGATNLAGANGLTEVSTGSTFATTPGCMIYLDSPATTSSVQYSVYARVTSGTATATICGTNETCSLIVIEIGVGD